MEFPGGLGFQVFTAMARIQSLVGELRSRKPYGTTNNQKTHYIKKKKKNFTKAYQDFNDTGNKQSSIILDHLSHKK